MSAGTSPPAPPAVAIDGPAGVGKSAGARQLAAALGLPYVRTGAMYRAMGWKALRAGVDPRDAEAVAALLAGADLALRRRDDGEVEVRLDGEPVEPHVRAPEVGAMASLLAQR